MAAWTPCAAAAGPVTLNTGAVSGLAAQAVAPVTQTVADAASAAQPTPSSGQAPTVSGVVSAAAGSLGQAAASTVSAVTQPVQSTVAESASAATATTAIVTRSAAVTTSAAGASAGKLITHVARAAASTPTHTVAELTSGTDAQTRTLVVSALSGRGPGDGAGGVPGDRASGPPAPTAGASGAPTGTASLASAAPSSPLLAGSVLGSLSWRAPQGMTGLALASATLGAGASTGPERSGSATLTGAHASEASPAVPERLPVTPPVPGGVSSSSAGSPGGSGFPILLLLAGLLLLGAPRATRRMQLASERWRLAPFLLIPDRPG